MTIPDDTMRTIEDRFYERRTRAIAAHDMPALAEAYADYTMATLGIYGLDLADQQKMLSVLEVSVAAQVDRSATLTETTEALAQHNLALEDRLTHLELAKPQLVAQMRQELLALHRRVAQLEADEADQAA